MKRKLRDTRDRRKELNGRDRLHRPDRLNGRNDLNDRSSLNGRADLSGGKDSKTVRKNFAYNELDTLAELLEAEAAEGWELSSKSGGVLGFRRSGCRRIRAACEVVYPDYGPEKEAFIQFCQAAGWRHVFSDGVLQVFETEDMDAEPIHTDPQVKLRLVHRECLTKIVLPLTLGILFALFIMWLFCWDPDCDQYLNGEYEIGLFLGPLCILCALVNIGRYVLWYAGAKRTVSSGGQPAYRKNPKVEKAANIFTKLYLAAMVLLLLAAVWMQWEIREARIMFLWFLLIAAAGRALIFCLQRRDARKGTGGRAGSGKYVFISVALILIFFAGNMAIISTDLFSADDPLTLSLEDLGIQTMGKTERSCDRSGLIFLQYESGSDLSENREGYKLYYDVFRTKTARTRDTVLTQRFFYFFDDDGSANASGSNNSSIDSGSVTQMPAEPFGAREVYLRSSPGQSGRIWLFLYDHRIVSVEVNFDLNEKQLAVIGDRLCGVHMENL